MNNFNSFLLNDFKENMSTEEDLNTKQEKNEQDDKAFSETKRETFKSKKTSNFVNRNLNKASVTDYKSMSHEQLIIEATRLQSHVTQLKNLLEKSNAKSTLGSLDVSNGNNKKRKIFKERPFNFDNYNKRHVFLKFLYLGWNYQVNNFIF
jgi:hypothetical protein